MKTSMQLNSLIRNLSAKKNVEAGIILRNFMQTFNEAEITSIVSKILSLPIDDNIEFTLKNIEEIREEADYPGYRISIEAVLDQTRQMLKMDLTTGASIVPKEIEYSFRLMFQDRAIGIMAYNLETILAEKLETVIARSVANTRMRDFYDIYILTLTQKFNYGNFKAALKNTAEKRDTVKQMDSAGEAIQAIAESTIMIDLWQRYQKKYSYATNVTWEMVIESLKRLKTTEDFTIFTLHG